MAPSWCQGLFLCLWCLMKENTQSGIFIALRTVDVFLLFGQVSSLFSSFALSVCLQLSVCARLSSNPSICRASLFISLPVCLSVYLSVCLSVRMWCGRRTQLECVNRRGWQTDFTCVVIHCVCLCFQCFVVFACFGMERQLIIVPFVKRYVNFWNSLILWWKSAVRDREFRNFYNTSII